MKPIDKDLLARIARGSMQFDDLPPAGRPTGKVIEEFEPFPSLADLPVVPWDDLYLLGWYDGDGRQLFTTWSGDRPLVHVVVMGARGLNFPLWDAAVPDGCVAYEIPERIRNTQLFAIGLGGYHAFGWRVAVKRRS